MVQVFLASRRTLLKFFFLGAELVSRLITGCEVKLRRFSEENTILLHKLAHINLRGRP